MWKFPARSVQFCTMLKKKVKSWFSFSLKLDSSTEQKSNLFENNSSFVFCMLFCCSCFFFFFFFFSTSTVLILSATFHLLSSFDTSFPKMWPTLQVFSHYVTAFPPFCFQDTSHWQCWAALSLQQFPNTECSAITDTLPGLMGQTAYLPGWVSLKQNVLHTRLSLGHDVTDGAICRVCTQRRIQTDSLTAWI